MFVQLILDPKGSLAKILYPDYSNSSMIKDTDEFTIEITYTLRKLVAANNCVLFGASSTLVMDITGSKTRKYTTASTATVTESFVKI